MNLTPAVDEQLDAKASFVLNSRDVESKLRVGVVAGLPQWVAGMVALVEAAGHEVMSAYHAVQALPQDPPPYDLWVVSAETAELASDFIERLDRQQIPVVFWEEDAALMEALSRETPELSAEAVRRLREKITLLTQGALQDTGSSPFGRAESVWVLAASTGGPKAVAEFLASIEQALPGVAFIYAQHIADDTLVSLKQMLCQQGIYAVKSVDMPCVLREKTLYLLSPSTQIELLASGVITPLSQAWEGVYAPSLDQVIAKVARIFGAKGGVIVFSGMGDDGARACQLLHHRGGQVWAQHPDSCTIDSMPLSAAQKVPIGEWGSPTELAQKLCRWQTKNRQTRVSAVELSV
jgi:chemosensory pili system protein ChpB (putative protein-glutamate methylesterase)